MTKKNTAKTGTPRRMKAIAFEDLTRLDDRSIRLVLREVDLPDLVAALKGASPAMIDLVTSTMGDRGAWLLKEDIKNTGPSPLAEVVKAQKAITAVAAKLEKAGEITVHRAGESQEESPAVMKKKLEG